MKKALLVSVSLVFTFGCGGDSGGTGSPTSADTPSPAADKVVPPTSGFPSMSFASALALPACAANIEGALAYLKAEKKFKTCESGQWKDIDVTAAAENETSELPSSGSQSSSPVAGPAGVDGDDCSVSNTGLVSCGTSTFQIPDFTPQYRGVAITAEAPGANCTSGGNRVAQFADTNGNGLKDAGEDEVGAAQFVCKDYNQVIASVSCGGAIGTTGIYFSYYARETEAGDLFAAGAIRSDEQQIGATSIFSRQQVGANSASVILLYDLSGAANAGWWQLSLNMSTLVTSITYNDLDYSAQPTTWTMTPDKCTVDLYDNDR